MLRAMAHAHSQIIKEFVPSPQPSGKAKLLFSPFLTGDLDQPLSNV